MDPRTHPPCGPADGAADAAVHGAVDAALFEGHVDAIEAGRIYGWALDPTAPAQPLSVTIFHGGDALGTVVADRYREDLCGYGDGSGRHAFVFTLPKLLWDADPAGFHVTHAGSSVPLVRPEGSMRKVSAGDPGDDPGWLAPVSARLAHLETALVATARATAFTQTGLRDLGRDDRLPDLEQTQLRIDQTLKAQAAVLAELRAAAAKERRRGRLHVLLTLVLLIGLAAIVAIRPGLLR